LDVSYVEIILKGEQWVDWAEKNSSSLRTQFKHVKDSKESFYMASYLTYCIACVSNPTSLPHEIGSEEITVYQYCPFIQKDKVLENFGKVHDVLIESVHLALKKASMPRLSSEAQKLIQHY
jgi:hypothetical protein